MGNWCSNAFGFNSERNEATFGFVPARKRGCTDILCLLLYICSWAAMVALIVVAHNQGGDPNRIIHGVNYKGEVCGNDGAQANFSYSAWVTLPTTDELLDTDDCDGCYKIRTCVKNCSDVAILADDNIMSDGKSYLPMDDLMHLCVPSFSAIGPNITLAFEAEFDSAANLAIRALSDLFVTWPVILVSAGVALIVCYIYTWFAKRIAGFLVFLAVVAITAGGVLCSYALLKKASESNGTMGSSRVTAMKGLGIAIAVVTGLFALIVIALRKRIYIAIEVVKESSRAVLDMSWLILFPIFPMLFGIAYFAFFIATTLFLVSAWSSEISPLPDRVANYRSSHADFLVDAPLVNGTTTPGFYDYSFNESLRGAFAYAFLHMLWTTQFLIYFTFMVVAGALANWYFAPRDESGNKVRGGGDNELRMFPIFSSFLRTLRYHLGTIAFGSLIIAIIRFLRAVIKYIEKTTTPKQGPPNRLQKAIFCLIQCCLYCVQCCFDKISKNAFVWTAIWGDCFASAACSSFALIWANLGRIAALSLVSNYLMILGKLLVSFLVTGGAGIFIERYYGNKVNSPVLPMVVVFILSYMVASVFMSVMETTVDTIFLCFLVDEKFNGHGGKMMASDGLQKVINHHNEQSQKIAQAEFASVQKVQGVNVASSN